MASKESECGKDNKKCELSSSDSSSLDRAQFFPNKPVIESPLECDAP